VEDKNAPRAAGLDHQQGDWRLPWRVRAAGLRRHYPALATSTDAAATAQYKIL